MDNVDFAATRNWEKLSLDNKVSIQIAYSAGWRPITFISSTQSWHWVKEHTEIYGDRGSVYPELIFPDNEHEHVRIEDRRDSSPHKGSIISSGNGQPRQVEDLNYFWFMVPDLFKEKNAYLALRAIRYGLNNIASYREVLEPESSVATLMKPNLHTLLNMLFNHTTIGRAGIPI